MRMDFSRSLSVRARVFYLINLLAEAINYARRAGRVFRTSAMSRHGHAIAVKLSLLGFFTAVSVESAGAADQPFYSGKTITVVIATGPGGTGHLRILRC